MDFQSYCRCFVLICGLVYLSSAAKLPPYIKACKTDGKLNECALKNGREAIPKFINGDAKFKIPRLDPFDINKIRIDSGSNQFGLKLDLMNMQLSGLKETEFIEARMDLPKRHIEWVVRAPRIQLYGDYKADGKILVLPITGTGKGNITLANTDLTYLFNYTLEKRNNKEYMKIVDSTFEFNTTRLYIKLENLFNGDKLLGENMNHFLDENWKEVLDELGTPLVKSLAPIFTLIINNIAKDVPFNEVFLK